MCNKSLNKTFGGKLFDFMLFMISFQYLVLCHPNPRRSHAFVAMQSIMLPMGSADQEKLACAIKV